MDTVKTIDPAHIQLASELAARACEFAVGSFIDITGRAKSKVVPIDHLPNLLAGSERYTPRGMGDLGQMTPNEDECVAVPDLVDAARDAVGHAVRLDGRRPAASAAASRSRTAPARS